MLFSTVIKIQQRWVRVEFQILYVNIFLQSNCELSIQNKKGLTIVSLIAC